MKKKLLGLFALLVGVMAIASCDQTTTSNDSSSDVTSEVPSEDTSSSSIDESSTPSSTPSVEVDEYNILPDWEVTNNFIKWDIMSDYSEITVDRAYQTGCDYYLRYEMLQPLISDHNQERVEVSNEKVLTATMTSDGFKVTCLHAGKSYIKVYDSENRVRSCLLVRVTDPIPLDYMEEYLVYDCEYFVSITGDPEYSDYFVLNFLEGGRYILTGYLTAQPIAITNGTYEFSETINNGKEYRYLFTDQDSKAYSFTGFDIACNGEMVYLESRYGTDAIMLPVALVEGDQEEQEPSQPEEE